MKLLLVAVNAKYIHSNLAVYNLRACAAAFYPDVLLREYTINQTKDEILKDLYKSGAEIFCFSCYIWNISFIKELAEDLKKVLPDAVIWAGGPEVSFNAERFLETAPAFAGVMIGEGEETFAELTAHYVAGKPVLSDIDGLTYRDMEKIRRISDRSCGEGGKAVCKKAWNIRSTPPRELTSLDKIPFIYQNMEIFRNRIIYYESSRGCPFSCSYCLSSIDKKLRFRSMDLVKKELQFFLDRKTPQVKFVDRTFNCRHDHAMEIWKYILEHDNGATNFHFEISADLLTEDELSLMERMRPGLIQLEIGVQSVNPQTLTAIYRHMDLEKLKRNVRRIHSFRNIHQHLDLIAGLPYEDYESFRRSFNEVYALRPDQLQLGFLKVLKGSLMAREAEKYGIIYKSREPYEVLYTRWLTYGDILRLKMVENMTEVYYNSGQFRKTLEYFLGYFADAFSFYEALGEFYEEKRYDEISHSRLRRYEILLEFAREREIPADEAAKFMIFDLYLRERLKKRPDFADDQKPYEEAVWKYRREKKVPRSAHIEVFADGRAVLFDYERRDPLSHNAHTEIVEIERVKFGSKLPNLPPWNISSSMVKHY